MSTVKSTHPHAAATSTTTPWHIWSSAAVEIAAVSYEDMERWFTRERLTRAYQLGEPAWIAADAIRAFVAGARKAERDDDSRATIRAAYRASLTR